MCSHESKEEVGGVSLREAEGVTENRVEEGLVHTEPEAQQSPTDHQEYQDLGNCQGMIYRNVQHVCIPYCHLRARNLECVVFFYKACSLLLPKYYYKVYGRDTEREVILDSLVFSEAVVFVFCFTLLRFHFHEQLVSLLQALSPLKIKICITIIPSPATTLYQAMERNWLIGNCAKITATPNGTEVVISDTVFE